MAPKKIAQTVLTEGKFYTISAANGKVIEVADYNIDNGAKIQLMDNANFEWQQWNFVAAGDGVYRIQNRFTGKMMDLDMGGVSDGTRVHQWEGAQASSQLWVVEPTNDGRVKIKSNLPASCWTPAWLPRTAPCCRSGLTSTVTTSSGPSTRSPASPRPA